MLLSPGDRAPDFELENHHRQPVRLSAFRGRKQVLLVFHPLAWTPVCGSEVAGLEERWPKLQALDTHVLGVSVDSSATKAAWARSLGGVSFDLLCDFYPHGRVAEQYGVLNPAGFADRAVFLLDRDGTVAWRQVYGMDECPNLDFILDRVASARKTAEGGPQPSA